MRNMQKEIGTSFTKLVELRDQHDSVGKSLMDQCSGKLYPCDGLYFAILNRSLELFDGVVLLLEQGNYGCCMALLRLQLDNVLRFYGVLSTNDPHSTANKVLNGEKLSSLKGADGQKLSDRNLVDMMAKQNPWVDHVYELACSYIHLSDQHFYQMLGRSDKIDDGKREICIGSGDEHLDPQHKLELINAFKVITEGLFKLLPEWRKLATQYSESELENSYSVLA